MIKNFKNLTKSKIYRMQSSLIKYNLFVEWINCSCSIRPFRNGRKSGSSSILQSVVELLLGTKRENMSKVRCHIVIRLALNFFSY